MHEYDTIAEMKSFYFIHFLWYHNFPFSTTYFPHAVNDIVLRLESLVENKVIEYQFHIQTNSRTYPMHIHYKLCRNRIMINPRSQKSIKSLVLEPSFHSFIGHPHNLFVFIFFTLLFSMRLFQFIFTPNPWRPGFEPESKNRSTPFNHNAANFQSVVSEGPVLKSSSLNADLDLESCGDRLWAHCFNETDSS